MAFEVNQEARLERHIIANKESPPIRQLYANKEVNKTANKESTPVMAFERKQRTQQIMFFGLCFFFALFSKKNKGEKNHEKHS